MQLKCARRDLDPAVRRRFEKRIYIPLPDEEARMHMLMSFFKGIEHSLDQQQMRAVAAGTSGAIKKTHG